MDATRTILLVEDNPDDVELTLRAFRKLGIPEAISVVRDGVEALDYMRAARVLPALVLLDLQLPKISGHEVLRRLRAEPRTRRVPIVILTSSNEESDIQSGYDLGANSFVRKPVNFSQFMETAKTLRSYWLLTNEPAT